MADFKPSRKIVFLLLSNTHLLDLAGPAQVFYEANKIGKGTLDIQYTSLLPDTISEQGVMLSGLRHPETIELMPGDFIIIPGIDFASFERGELCKEIEDIQEWLSKQFSAGVQLVSVCTGTLILAEAGLLDGFSCTSHWKCLDYLKENYPDANVHSDRLFVKDRNIYSSAGMTSGMDMSLAILEELFGPILTSKVAREMVVFLRRDKDHSQETIYLDYQTHFNPAIHKVQDYIISHPSVNPTLEKLADIANMSTRTLTRTFKAVTQSTITEFKHEVKVEHAKSLLNNPEYTIERIAKKCGYQNARQLRRIWKEKFSNSLTDYRE